MEFITIKRDDKINHVALKGSLDKEGTDQIDLDFSLNIITYKKPTLIDISNVDYISSWGLRMLVTTVKKLDISGIKTVLLKPQPFVEDVLIKAGFDKVMTIEHDESAAIAALGLDIS